MKCWIEISQEHSTGRHNGYSRAAQTRLVTYRWKQHRVGLSRDQAEDFITRVAPGVHADQCRHNQYRAFDTDTGEINYGAGWRRVCGYVADDAEVPVS